MVYHSPFELCKSLLAREIDVPKSSVTICLEIRVVRIEFTRRYFVYYDGQCSGYAKSGYIACFFAATLLSPCSAPSKLLMKELSWKLTDNLYPLIRKVRTVVKLFRKSPTKIDILQKHIKALQLLIDVKTQWNSLVSVLKQFNQVKNCILKSLIDVHCVI
jgi:hypothetical protein